MGWFLSEGSTVHRDKAFDISQIKKPQRERLKQLLKDCGFNARWTTKGARVHSPAWWAYLRQFGKCRDKFVPLEIKQATADVLEVFFNAAMDGDGCWAGEDSGVYYTLSRQLADDMSEIAVKLGYCVYMTHRQRHNRNGLSYEISFSHAKPIVLNTGNHVYNVKTQAEINVTRQIYKGLVYCVTVPETETFLIRQHGCIWLSGNTWVKRRWKIGALGEPTCFRDEVHFPDGHVEYFWRSFIPAKLTDNPHLMKDRRYMMRLMMLPDRLRKALLEGRWDLTEGQFFNHFDYKIHIKKPFPIPLDWPRWRSMDWGYRKPYSIGYYTMDPDGIIYRYREVYGYGGEANVGTRETAGTVAKKLIKIERPERQQGIEFLRNPADRSIWIENGFGVEISIGEIFSKNKVKWFPASQGPRSRASRCALMQQLLYDKQFFVFDTCEHWIRTVPELQVDEDDPEVYDTDMEDHAADETGYSLVSRHSHETKDKKDENKPKPGTFDYMIEQTETKKKKHPYRL